MHDLVVISRTSYVSHGAFLCAHLSLFPLVYPRKVVFEAIRRNKHVITANKALVAMYLGDIQQLLKEHPGVTFGYEAAVCGGEQAPRLTAVPS